MAQRYEEFRERNGYNNDRGERGSGGRGTHLLIHVETTQFYVEALASEHLKEIEKCFSLLDLSVCG